MDYHLWIIIPAMLGFAMVFFTPIYMMNAEQRRYRRQSEKRR